jgi:hypothetical protein
LSGRSEIGDRWDTEVAKDGPVERGSLSDFPVLNFDWELEGLLEDPDIDIETPITFEGLDAVAIEMLDDGHDGRSIDKHPPLSSKLAVGPDQIWEVDLHYSNVFCV